MTRKKSFLWLNKIKRRKNEENRGLGDWSTIIFQTPQNSIAVNTQCVCLRKLDHCGRRFNYQNIAVFRALYTF